MVAVLFEGKSDEQFLSSICSACGLKTEDILYYNFEGKDNIFNIKYKYYDDIEESIKKGKIEKILLIVDADNKKDLNPNRGYEASEKKLKEVIKNLYFNIDVDYYIMCDEKKEGNLESFLLSVLDKKQLDCIDEFRKCYEYDLSDKWVYNSFYKQKEHPFDYEHSNFSLFKEKLSNLFKG